MRALWFIPVIIACLPLAALAQTVSLEEAFQAAIKRSEVLGQQEQRVIQSEELVRQARGSILPSLRLQASYLVQERPSDPLAREFSPSEQPSVSLNLSQPLFRGLREFAGLSNRKNLLESQRNTRTQALHLLYQDVVSSYLNILALEQDLKTLRSLSDLYEERLGELRGRVRIGESQKTDSLSAQAAQAGTLAEIETTNGQLRVARQNFAFLTGLPAETSLADPGVFKVNGAPILKDVREYLSRIDQRPDARAAKDQLAASEDAVRVARGAHWPTLDLSANYYLKRPPGFGDDIHWDFRLGLTLPIYEGGVIESQVRQASSVRLETELALSRVRRLAEQDIRSLYDQLQAYVKQIKALENASELAERNYRALRQDYRRGLTRNLDVLSALADLRLSNRSLDRVRFTAQLDYLRLLTAAMQSPPGLVEGTPP